MRLVYHAASLARVLGSTTGRKICIFIPLKMTEKLQWPFLREQYAYAKTKAQVTAELISVFVFATKIVQSSSSS